MSLIASRPRPPLILASTSRYRRELLERLRLPFSTDSPRVEERPQRGETPAAMAERLALAKAHEVSRRHPDAVVIGADQVADLAGAALGKPGAHPQAVAQLQSMSGQTVVFHTAVAVLRPARGFERWERVSVTVRFRRLELAEIEAYLYAEEPYDCAGSAKSEGLGIALLDAVESDDPTALIGLPLIATSRLLREAGIDPLQSLA
jgi:septum formation protein